jgi:hypothetical protein
VALCLALILATCFMFLFGRAVLLSLEGQIKATPRFGVQGLSEWLLGIGVLYAPQEALDNIVGRTANPAHFWAWTLSGCLLMVLLLVVASLRFAARSIDRSWQDKGPSLRQQALVKEYCTPLFRRWFSRKMQKKLDRNPIAWLQQYSWKARLVKWGLCLAFVLIGTTVLLSTATELFSDARDATRIMFLLVLAAAMTFSGINSFFEEKRSGALELILVTPISVNQIISGRVWGLLKQFLPAGLMLAGWDTGCLWIVGDLKIYLQPGSVWGGHLPADYLPDRAALLCGFLALPFCATYFALRVKNLIAAAVLTWVTILIAPFFAAACNKLLYGDEASFIFLLLLGNLGLVLLVAFLLRHSLSRRIYSF